MDHVAISTTANAFAGILKAPKFQFNEGALLASTKLEFFALRLTQNQDWVATFSLSKSQIEH